VTLNYETGIEGLTIRPFRPDDREELLALNAYGLNAAGIAVDQDHYGGQDTDDLGATYSEAAGGAMLVGEVDGRIVAMGGIRRIDAMTCELLRMRVYPDHQGRGFGRALLELLEREAQRLGYTQIKLLTGEHQEPAVSLYRRHGYRVSSRETLIGIPSLHMTKDLAPASVRR
jgi:GNAT superfamily N-acetyltransferase